MSTQLVNIPPFSPKQVENFWKKVNKTSDCWLWLASKNKKGYGHFSIGKQNVKAHRFSYLLANEILPNDQLVLHSCDNPSCVNPNHLSLGSDKTNAQDKMAKQRHWVFNAGIVPSEGYTTGTHCLHGHEFTPENTRISERDGRVCKECNRLAVIAYKGRKQQS